jgi:hypothetical protein
MDARMGIITARVQGIWPEQVISLSDFCTGEPSKKRRRIQEAKTTIIDVDVNQYEDVNGDAGMYMDFGNDFGLSFHSLKKEPATYIAVQATMKTII